MGLSLGAGDSWDELRHQASTFGFNIHDGLEEATSLRHLGDLRHAERVVSIERRRAPRIVESGAMAAD